MPYEHVLLQEAGYFLVVGRAPVGLSETLESMNATISAVASTPRLPILVDIRDADYEPTEDEARNLGALLADPRLSGSRRVAFVAVPGVQFGLARMVSQLSGREGGAVAVFTDTEAALAWLAPPSR